MVLNYSRAIAIWMRPSLADRSRRSFTRKSKGVNQKLLPRGVCDWSNLKDVCIITGYTGLRNAPMSWPLAQNFHLAKLIEEEIPMRANVSDLYLGLDAEQPRF